MSIELPSGLDRAECVILDVLGRVVYHGEVTREHGRIELHCSTGSYHVLLTSGDWRYTTQLLHVEE
jgi:hypothetical protein